MSVVKHDGTSNGISTEPRNYKTFCRNIETSPKDDSTYCCDAEDKRNDNEGGHDKKRVLHADKTFTMQEAIDSIGFGPFQILVSFLFGFTYMADSMEVMMLSVLAPVLKCVFHLNPGEVSLLTIVVFVGMLIFGNPWGKIGDKFGRKTAMFLSTLTCSYFGVLTAFSPSYLWICINRFIVAVGLGGFPQIFTYYSEFLPTKSRGSSIVFLGLIWAIGACFEVVLAMVTLPSFRWRLFLFCTACPIIIVTCLIRFLPESPRFLLAQGRTEEAYAILQKVARMNKKNMPDGKLYYEIEKKPDKNNISHLFLPQYLRTTVLLSIIYAGVNMSYYGITLLTTALIDKKDGCHGYKSETQATFSSSCRSLCTSLTQSDYVDLLISSLGESCGVLFCIFMMTKFGRRVTIGTHTILFTIVMAVMNVCAPRNVLVGLSFCARALTNGASQSLFVYTTEVYPTPIRAIGMGWCVTLKSAGVIICAVTSSVLLNYSSYLAITSLAVAGFISTVSVCLLPYETRERKMADTLEEIQD